MTEDEFVTIVTITAENHKCRVMEIDFETKLFQIACPKGNDLMCAAELEEVLEVYCESETLMGWPLIK